MEGDRCHRLDARRFRPHGRVAQQPERHGQHRVRDPSHRTRDTERHRERLAGEADAGSQLEGARGAGQGGTDDGEAGGDRQAEGEHQPDA